MNQDIPLFLISGFLGAGKTTFLKNILNGFEGEKVGVIVNEFGEVSIDAVILKKDGIDLIEINNGSIFCTCRVDGFIDALITFSKMPIDLLFIENSGLGDPSNMLKILKAIQEKTERKYSYKGAICLADCTTFPEFVDLLTPIQNQIAASNFVIINKTDLVDQERIYTVHKLIQEINPMAFLIDTQYAKIPGDILESKLFVSRFVGETSNHEWNRPAVYTLQSNIICTKEQIEKFITLIQDKILRIKGFLNSSNGKWHIEGTIRNLTIDQFHQDQNEEPKIIVIGKDQEPFSDLIRESWLKIFCEEPVLIGDTLVCSSK
ncbi:MAG: GTP-binding protein [Flexilinea sp.]